MRAITFLHFFEDVIEINLFSTISFCGNKETNYTAECTCCSLTILFVLCHRKNKPSSMRT